MRRRTLSVIDLIEANSMPEPNTGCWLWLGNYPHKEQNYGRLQVDGVQHPAHRISYEAHHGVRVAPWLDVRHGCDNPACVNPGHLSIGTRQQNVGDMVRRNRQAKGEKVNTAKLSLDQVVEIRRLCHESDDFTVSGLSRKYGVSRPTMRDVIHGRSWKHIVETVNG